MIMRILIFVFFGVKPFYKEKKVTRVFVKTSELANHPVDGKFGWEGKAV